MNYGSSEKEIQKQPLILKRKTRQSPKSLHTTSIASCNSPGFIVISKTELTKNGCAIVATLDKQVIQRNKLQGSLKMISSQHSCRICYVLILAIVMKSQQPLLLSPLISLPHIDFMQYSERQRRRFMNRFQKQIKYQVAA